MYSVKPGRGPSAFGAVGGVIAAVFGVCWTIGASSMGAPGFFVAFGAVFVLMALAGVAYNLFNTVSPNRASTFDVVHSSSEPDPFGPRVSTPASPAADGDGFCPYCGTALSSEFAFCPKCGKSVPGGTTR